MKQSTRPAARELTSLRRIVIGGPRFTRQDVADLKIVARRALDVQFAGTDDAILADLLDRWSLRAVIVALSLLADEHGPAGAAEAFRQQGERALKFLAETRLAWDDVRLADEWRRFQAGEPLRAGTTELGRIALAAFEGMTAEGETWIH